MARLPESSLPGDATFAAPVPLAGRLPARWRDRRMVRHGIHVWLSTGRTVAL